MKYTEFKKIKEERMNTLDIKFAFTEEHFNQIMKEWGLQPTDTHLVTSLGSGGIMQKKDIQTFVDVINQNEKDWQAYMQDDEFLKGAFIYELANHEFIITYEHGDALDALGLKYDELDERQLSILEVAKEEYLKNYQDY